MTEDQRKLHEELLDVRNEHVAHRVDDREVGMVYLRVTKDRTNAGRFAKLARYAHPTPERVRSISALLDLWLRVMKIYAEAGGERLMELAHEDWPDVLRQLDSAGRSKPPRPDDSGM